MKVICNKAKTCRRECGAKTSHTDNHCEPCPFDTHAECVKVKVKTVLCYQGEEYEMK